MCIAWTQRFAGDLGAAVLYRAWRDERRRLHVGYFVYWSTERPWGDNGLTRALVPALLIDAFYSHLFFVMPGAQALLYGAGDVEGVHVVYEPDQDGNDRVVSVTADNESHELVELAAEEAVDDAGRLVLLNDVWSHQLGGRGAAQAMREGAEHRCYEGASLLPLSSDIVDAFRLGSPENPRRATPAWAF